MAFIPHFYSGYQYSPNEFSEITSVMARENYAGTFSSTNISSGTFPSTNISNETISSGATISDGAMFSTGDNNNFPILFNNYGIDIFSTESVATSPVGPSSFPEGHLAIPDMVVPTLLDHYKMGEGIGKIQNFGGGLQLADDVCEFGEDCYDFVPTFKPLSVCPAAGENWGIQCSRIMPDAIDHTHMKVGKYTVEERKDRILRYLKKRNQRNFNKTIKYACRKTLADRRVRVRGRFARNNNEPGEEESTEVIKKNSDNHLHQQKESYCCDDFQMKNDDDEWIQEAMASPMYVPYIAGI